MSHNPPKRPVPLNYFSQAKFCGFQTFSVLCLNCGRSCVRSVKKTADRYSSLTTQDYERRSRCLRCRQRRAELKFHPGGIKPGALIEWWVG